MKYVISVLIVLLFVSNGFWAVMFLDGAVSCMYSDSSAESMVKINQQTTMLANLNLIGKNSDEAIKLIGKDIYGLDPFIKEGCIWAGQVCIKLSENNVVTGFGK